jgi:hypothetical protein
MIVAPMIVTGSGPVFVTDPSMVNGSPDQPA